MKNRIWLFVLICLFLTACATPSDTVVQNPEVRIGTASPDGVYQQVGQSLAGLLNKAQSTYTAAAYSTEGSAANIEALLNGELTFAFVQSDRQYQAYHGLSNWSTKGPQSNLRSIAALYPEMITLVVRGNSNIYTVADLKGKHINLGAFGSGEYQNAMDVLTAAQLNQKTDMMGEFVPARENASLLKEGILDGYFLTTAHPSNTISNSVKRKEQIHMVSLDDALIRTLIKQHPYYHAATIPAQKYYASPVSTIGVMAILTTSTHTSDDVAYAITKVLVENFERFKSIHPAFHGRTLADLTTNLPTPLHPGAKRYYEEKGLLAK